MYLLVLFLITNILLFHYRLSFFNLISSLNIGGRQGSFVPIFGFSNVKIIRITLHFNGYRKKIETEGSCE